MFLFSLLYLCVLLSCLAKFQVKGFTYFALSLRMPVAQNLVGTAYQDGPGKQGGLEATPRVWRDREGDEEQQAAHKPSQHSPPVPADQLLCAGHHLGVSCKNQD